MANNSFKSEKHVLSTRFRVKFAPVSHRKSDTKRLSLSKERKCHHSDKNVTFSLFYIKSVVAVVANSVRSDSIPFFTTTSNLTGSDYCLRNYISLFLDNRPCPESTKLPGVPCSYPLHICFYFGN